MTHDDKVRAFRALLRSDFGAFAARCFQHLHPDTPFHPGWHIDLLAAELAGLQAGAGRLIINMPPRNMKSLLGSVAFPAWVLGHNPSAQLICVSYNAELANKHSRDFRSVIEAPFYQGTFPTRLARVAVNEMTTTANGFRMATSVEGVLTGRGASMIIIDDPLKPNEALSDTTRLSVNEWFSNTLYSRLNDKNTGSIVLIMQRLHEDDLAGHLLLQGGWKHISLPAIAEQDERFQYTARGKTVVVGRKAGAALHPARESLASLEQTRRVMGEHSFAGQYQQVPVPREGGMIKRKWLRTYRPEERPERFERIVQSWDTANKVTELSDYSVCTTWGLKGGHFYLLHVFRKKLDYPTLKRAVLEQAELFRAKEVVIEDKASGTQLIQDLIHEGMYSVKRFQPEAGLDKQMRLYAQSGVFENGFVHLPHKAEWLDVYVHELTTFPAGKHDDQVDSTSQALHHVRSASSTTGIIDYYEQLIRDRNGGRLPPELAHYENY